MLASEKWCIAEACSWISTSWHSAQAWACGECARAIVVMAAAAGDALRNILYSGLVQWLSLLLFLLFLILLRSWRSGMLSGLLSG